MTVLYGIMSLLSASRHQKKFRGRQQGEWKWTTEDQHAWAQCEKNQAGWNSNSWERKPTSTPASSTKDSSISSQSIIPYQLIKQEWTPDTYAYTWHHLWQSISVEPMTVHFSGHLTDGRPSFQGPYQSGTVFIRKSPQLTPLALLWPVSALLSNANVLMNKKWSFGWLG